MRRRRRDRSWSRRDGNRDPVVAGVCWVQNGTEARARLSLLLDLRGRTHADEARAQELRDGLLQIARLERIADVALGAHQLGLPLEAEAGDDYDRDLLRHRRGAQLLEQLAPVHHR